MMDGSHDLQKKQKNNRGVIFVSAMLVTVIVVVATILIVSRNNNSSPYPKFIETMTEFKERGDHYNDVGMQLQAHYYYGMAGSSISAMRFAIENLLAMKGEEDLVNSIDNPYTDWESIGMISFASPYPYYFEGLIYHIQGNESKAQELYKNAILNSSFPEDGISFYYLNELSTDKLSEIWNELYTMESEIYNEFNPESYEIDRHPMNYNDGYLRAKAKDILEQDPNNYSEARKYYHAALMANPFETKNFACCAIISIFEDDINAAIDYVNEGFWVEEDNEELKKLATWLTYNGE